MKTRYTLWATSLLLASFSSLADTKGYQMVVIEEDAMAAAIRTGDLNTALQTHDVLKPVDAFARQMNLCVAYTKTEQLAQASDACHKAVITVRQSTDRPSELLRSLRAYAYNNRGVAKMLGGDNTGALADFQRANEIESNSINQHNLKKLASTLNGVKTQLTASLASNAPG